MRVTASDLVGLIKVSLQLYGEPTERVELSTGSGDWATLRTVILGALEAYPEAGSPSHEALEGGDDD